MKIILSIIFCVFITLHFPGYSQVEPDLEKLPTVQWRFKTNQPIFSSPVIDGENVYFGGTDSTLYALKLTTGAVVWKYKTSGEIRSTLKILNDNIYLLGGNGILSCFHKNTGNIVWQRVFDNTATFIGERRYDFADYYHSSPLIHNNVLYFGAGNGVVSAVKADTGELLWSFKAGDIIHNTPVVVKDKLYIGSFDGHVYALNIFNGQLIWKFKSVGHQYFPMGEMQGSPAAAFGTVLIGSRDYNFYALNANLGYAKWNKKFEAGWALSASVKDTVVYVGTSDDRILLALDLRNGQELWRRDVKFNIFGGCAFTNKMVYVGTIWGKLFGLDQKTGDIRWVFETDGYRTNKSRYYKPDDTFRDDIGKILRSPAEFIGAEYKMGGIFSTPAISNKWMIVTTTEGMVYGLRGN